jgi:hypothetical protein
LAIRASQRATRTNLRPSAFCMEIQFKTSDRYGNCPGSIDANSASRRLKTAPSRSRRMRSEGKSHGRRLMALNSTSRAKFVLTRPWSRSTHSGELVSGAGTRSLLTVDGPRFIITVQTAQRILAAFSSLNLPPP